MPIVGQTHQKGKTLEYHGKKAKTSLPNVEIIASGASTKSGKNGQFVLELKTLKTGDKIDVYRVAKAGYRIFNEEALKQWYVSNEKGEFHVVLCKSEYFDQMVSSYYSISYKSYTEERNRQNAEIKNLRAQKKISELEFKKQIESIEKKYEDALKQLQAHAELMARIDQSELDSISQKALELTADGKIDDAIKLINEHSSLVKLRSIVDRENATRKRLEDVLHDKESVIKAVKTEIYILQAKGGENNISKCCQYWMEIAEADSANFQNLVKCYDFQSMQKNISYAQRTLQMMQYASKNDIERFKSIDCQADFYELQSQYQKAYESFEEAINIGNKLVNNATDVEKLILGKTYMNYGTFLFNMGKDLSSLKILSKADSILSSVTSPLDESNESSLYYYQSGVYDTEGAILTSEGKYSDAIKKHEEAIRLIQKSDSIEHSFEKSQSLVECRNNLISAYFSTRDQRFTQIIDSISKENISYLRSLREKNPIMIDDVLAISLCNHAIQLAQYPTKEKYKEAESLFTEGLHVLDSLYSNNPLRYQYQYSKLMINYYHTKYAEGETDNAFKIAKQALDLCKENYDEVNRPVKLKDVEGTICTDISSMYGMSKQYGEAESYIKQTIELYKGFDDENSIEKYTQLGLALNNYGYLCLIMEQYDSSKSSLLESLSDFEKALTGQNELFLAYYTVMPIHNLADLNFTMEEYQTAKGYYDQAINLYKKILTYDKSKYETQMTRLLPNYAVNMIALGDFEKADSLVNSAFEINKGNESAKEAKIYFLLSTGDMVGASQLYEEIKDQKNDMDKTFASVIPDRLKNLISRKIFPKDKRKDVSNFMKYINR